MSGGQGVASSNLASPTLFALVKANLHRLGRLRISRSFTRISHDPCQSGSEPGGRGPSSFPGAREVRRVGGPPACAGEWPPRQPVVSRVRCIIRASVWRTLWSRTSGPTSAVRHNTAKRAEYASGLTDVPSASTSTRPVFGYLINDSAELINSAGCQTVTGPGVAVLLPGSLDAGRDVDRDQTFGDAVHEHLADRARRVVAPGEVLDACLPELVADRQTKTPKDGPQVATCDQRVRRHRAAVESLRSPPDLGWLAKQGDWSDY
jgi:hypothetical protein